ncbi:MAG: type II secretion system protein GspL [Pseudomarimonas sp.]
MPHRLVIRLFADGASEWLALDRAGKVEAGPSLGLPADSAAQVDLLLPAEQVLLLEAPRLAKRASQLAQALPYAIEEQLAGAVELQHVAFDERAAGATVPVAVIARDRLREAIKRLQVAGHSADRCHSPLQLLPVEAGQLSILVDGDESLLRWAPSAGLSCRTLELDETIALLLESGVNWQRIRLWRSHRSPLVKLQTKVVVEESLIPAALPWLAERFAHLRGPDLLQAEFRPRRSGGRSDAQWRWAAVLASLAVLAGLRTIGLEAAALERHTEVRQSEMEALLREALPGITRVVDPVAQLGAELDRRSGSSGGGALPLLAKVAPLIAGSGRFTIEALDYRAGTLEITISAPDVAALDGLRATLAAVPQMQVELTSALPGSNGYEGRLRIKDGSA